MLEKDKLLVRDAVYSSEKLSKQDLACPSKMRAVNRLAFPVARKGRLRYLSLDKEGNNRQVENDIVEVRLGCFSRDRNIL